MSSSKRLRENIRQHVVKNKKSKTMDIDVDDAIKIVIEELTHRYSELKFEHAKSVKLTDIIDQLKRQYPQFADKFASVHSASSIKPDGGFLYAVNKEGERRLILVAEIKRQGTNDERREEGLPQQALGNAIERLGKNVIGVRALSKAEGVFPFVCFGSGYDFRPESSIIDRVITINEFFPLNTTIVKKIYQPFEPCSLYFRYRAWTITEMVKIMLKIATEAIEYRFI